MDNVNNPYLGIAEFVKSGSNTQDFSFCIGKVLSVSPLIVQGNNLSFSGDDLYVNTDIMAGTNRQAEIKCLSVDGDTSDGAKITSLDIKKSTITALSSALTVGCKVLLLISDDKQTIVVVCKLRRG